MSSSSCNCPVSQPGPTLASTCGGIQYMVFMGLLEVFLRSQCDLEDPCNRPVPTPIQPEYDFIVIGSGSGGSVVASRLSEIPDWQVLLIEAGLEEPTGAQVPSMFLNFFGTSIDWGYKTESEPEACLGEEDTKCYWPRGKVLGGTTVMNGMMYIRGSKKDYDNWARDGNEGWSYNEVLPYFLKSEDNKQIDKMERGYHATGGLLTVSQFPYHPPLSKAILKGAQELGYMVRDHNGAGQTGFSIAQTTNRNGSRLSVAKAFLRPFKHRKNLHILLNTTVIRILINSTTKQAYGVELLNSAGEKQVIYASKEVILSGGAVNSPQLLLLSGIGPEEDLQYHNIPVIHNLPGVGKNLQNHVAYFVHFTINDTNSAPLNWATAMEYLLFRDGLMSGTGISEVTGFINTKYTDPQLDYPDIQYFFGGFLANCARTGQVGEKIDNSSRSIQIIPAVVHPKSRGYLTLKDNNPLSHPLIYANYFTHPDDVQVLIEGVKFAIELTSTKALRRYGFQLDRTPTKGCEHLKFGTDQYWECSIKHQTGPENHQAGSCKMGPISDPLAVVNPLLQVHGVDRLRVIDASIMPTVTSGNTNAPVIMIAERGADLLKSRWLTSRAGFYYANQPISQRIDYRPTTTQIKIIFIRLLYIESNLDLDHLENLPPSSNRVSYITTTTNSKQRKNDGTIITKGCCNSKNLSGASTIPTNGQCKKATVIKVLVLGAAGVGKTSIIQRFIHHDFPKRHTTTITRAIYHPTVIRNDRIYELQLSDLPPLRNFPQDSADEWHHYPSYGLRHSQFYVLVFDLSNLETFNTVGGLRDQILDSRPTNSAPPQFVVVGNKKDRILARSSAYYESGDLAVMDGLVQSGSASTTSTTECFLLKNRRRDIMNLVRKHWKCAYIECSARHFWNITKIFNELIDAVDHVNDLESDNSPTTSEQAQPGPIHTSTNSNTNHSNGKCSIS